MKFFLYPNGETKGKRIKVSELEKLVGKERLKEIKRSALETYQEDPFIENAYLVKGGTLIVEVELK